VRVSGGSWAGSGTEVLFGTQGTGYNRPTIYIYILEKIYEKFLMHFKMNRHTLEILGRNYGGSVWRKWMAILGTGDCHARHFEAANEMGTQRRKTGR